MDLTVITVVENDCGTLDLMIRSVLKFTDFVPKFILCCNNPTEYTNISEYYRGRDYIEVVANSTDILGGSFRHGSGLNAIFPLVTTKYTAIIESDCAVVSPDWYKLDSGYKMLAAIKKERLYHVCFMVFETECLRDMDFSPGLKGGQSSVAVMGVHGFSRVDVDVAWRVRNFIDSKDIQLLEFIDCKTGQGQHFAAGFQSDELTKDGKTIVVHLGRGSNLDGKQIRPGFQSPQIQCDSWKLKVGKLIE